MCRREEVGGDQFGGDLERLGIELQIDRFCGGPGAVTGGPVAYRRGVFRSVRALILLSAHWMSPWGVPIGGFFVFSKHPRLGLVDSGAVLRVSRRGHPRMHCPDSTAAVSPDACATTGPASLRVIA